MDDSQTLRLLTFDDATLPETTSGETSFQDHKCTGYTCDFPLCVAEREQRASMGVKRPPAQPWEPRQRAA